MAQVRPPDTEKDNLDGEFDEINRFEHAGLMAIDKACSQLYPDQPCPLQATAFVKFWLGGPDPLDYISMYSNNGDPDKNIPPHWHYITFGFSDLHGDDRVHPFSGPGELSGFGFELTLRLKKAEGETSPPMWPAALLNKLANYVFQTGNILDVGDHIPWHKSLDEEPESKSIIRHMLITEDPELSLLDTPHGSLEFRQVIGVTDDEVKAAQHWQGSGILELLKNSSAVGPYYITNLYREKSLFELDPELIQLVSDGIRKDGSNLGHVTAVCTWREIKKKTKGENADEKESSKEEDKKEKEETINETSSSCETKKEENKTPSNTKAEKEEKKTEDEEQQDDEDADSNQSAVNIDAVELLFDLEAAELLPVVIKGRLKKGRFFVFHSADNHAIHLVPTLNSPQEMIFVSEEEPVKAEGVYLQIYCPPSFIDKMADQVCIFEHLDAGVPEMPLIFTFDDPNITITVTNQICVEVHEETEDNSEEQKDKTLGEEQPQTSEAKADS